MVHVSPPNLLSPHVVIIAAKSKETPLKLLDSHLHNRRLITVARQQRALVLHGVCLRHFIHAQGSITSVKYLAHLRRRQPKKDLHFPTTMLILIPRFIWGEPRSQGSCLHRASIFLFFDSVRIFRLGPKRERKGLLLCGSPQSTINKAQQFNCSTKDYRSARSPLPA